MVGVGLVYWFCITNVSKIWENNMVKQKTILKLKIYVNFKFLNIETNLRLYHNILVVFLL